MFHHLIKLGCDLIYRRIRHTGVRHGHWINHFTLRIPFLRDFVCKRARRRNNLRLSGRFDGPVIKQDPKTAISLFNSCGGPKPLHRPFCHSLDPFLLNLTLKFYNSYAFTTLQPQDQRDLLAHRGDAIETVASFLPYAVEALL